jgi:hypothetical protein
MATIQNSRTAEIAEDGGSEQQFFEYLDLLRDSGVTNMFGAVPYLVRDCGLSRPAATRVLATWMRTFADRQAVRP